MLTAERWLRASLVTQSDQRIDLCGAVTTDQPHMCPGCAQCEQTYSDLKEIAEWAQPASEKELTCEILAFDHALHMGRGASHRPEIVVAMHLSNEHFLGQISDRDQERCLHDMRERLAELGVTPR